MSSSVNPFAKGVVQTTFAGALGSATLTIGAACLGAGALPIAAGAALGAAMGAIGYLVYSLMRNTCFKGMRPDFFNITAVSIVGLGVAIAAGIGIAAGMTLPVSAYLLGQILAATAVGAILTSPFIALFCLVENKETCCP